MNSSRLCAFILTAMAVSPVCAQQTKTDAWAGTWVLNLAKSSYELGPAPKSAVSRLEPLSDGWWKGSQDSVDAAGRPAHLETTVKFDGKDYPVDGAPNTTWALTRIDDHTYDLVAKRDGKITATARTVVSADGKTRTTTTTVTNAQGQALKNVAVYDSEPRV